MFQTVEDFLGAWQYESGQTIKLLAGLTDESLAMRPVAEWRSVGELATHLTRAHVTIGGQLGLTVPPYANSDDALPGAAQALCGSYAATASAIAEQAGANWTDENLTDAISFYGRELPLAVGAMFLLKHEIHHRGQLTVLMRAAGLPVHGIYGPTKEDWVAMGRQPMP